MIGLRETSANRARVFAFRIQGDLRLRTRPMRNTVWETAFASGPEQGTSAEELLNLAIEDAKEGRRRLA